MNSKDQPPKFKKPVVAKPKIINSNATSSKIITKNAKAKLTDFANKIRKIFSKYNIKQNKKFQKRALLIGCPILFFLIAIVVTIIILNNTNYSAEKAVENYINQIAEGNLDEASRLVPIAQIPETSRGLLFGNAANKTGPLIDEKNRIHNIKISDATSENNITTVKVSYYIKDTQRTEKISAEIKSKSFGFLNNWSIITNLIKQSSLSTNSTGVQSFTANDTEFNIKSFADSRSGIIYSYPGIYNISADTKSKYIAGDKGELVVPTNSEISLKITPSSKLKEAINTSLKKEIDSCVKRANEASGKTPEDCPFYSYVYTDDSKYYRNYSWSVIHYPTVKTLDFDNGSVSLNSGEMKLGYQYHEYKSSYCDKSGPWGTTKDMDTCYAWTDKDSTISVSKTNATYKIVLDEKKNESVEVTLSKW
ncbi:MAG: hypothetical protein LBT91_00375 [Bifidobacteriaceae bacterium]|jgi:hypothetical protein|nr:hypothetical protein [Bifidobacteriaceae bacterium]